MDVKQIVNQMTLEEKAAMLREQIYGTQKKWNVWESLPLW